LAARKCEARALETKIFDVGDAVEAIEKRECNGQVYRMRGEVVAVIGPRVVDEEETKWVYPGDKDWYNKHVFQYEVAYVCPICNGKKMTLYFAPELKKLF
jgi:hypothetical protein